MKETKNGYFLWPKGNIKNLLISYGHACSINDLELKLSSMFAGAYPVLCSSGRSALALALKDINISRNDCVETFPYASHCVLDIISRVSTPANLYQSNQPTLRIIYHQWGFSFIDNSHPPAIEDAVDSFYKRGSKLLECNGSYEIWSLPKIIGSTSGGILWCKSEDVANRVRNLRDMTCGSNIQFLMRLFGRKFKRPNLYWQSFEGYSCSLVKMQIKEISMLLNKWDNLYKIRVNRLHLYKDFLPEWIKFSDNRIPCVLPVETNISEKRILDMGLESGYRYFYRGIDIKKGCKKFSRVLPVPIHQEVDDEWLKIIFNEILLKGN